MEAKEDILNDDDEKDAPDNIFDLVLVDKNNQIVSDSDVILHRNKWTKLSDHPALTFKVKNIGTTEVTDIMLYPDAYDFLASHHRSRHDHYYPSDHHYEPAYNYDPVYLYLLLMIGIVIICLILSKCLCCIGGWLLNSYLSKRVNKIKRRNEYMKYDKV